MANLLDALIKGEEGFFVGVAQNSHNHPLIELAASLYNVEVSVGNGIETAWVNCDRAIHYCLIH